MLKMTLSPTKRSIKEFHSVFTSLEQLPQIVADELVRPLIDFVREVGINEIFDREGIPSWALLALPTVKQRLRLGFPGTHPILVRTGSLRASLTERGHPHNIEVIQKQGGNVMMVLGTTDPRFGVLHAGWPARRIPARPMLPVGGFMRALMTRAEADILVHRFDEVVKRG